jgi:TPR repeat protein
MTDALTIDRINAMEAGEVATILSGPPETKAEFVRVAAEAGVPDAQAVYGQMLLHGQGVPADPWQAVRWFNRAAHQHHPMAINMIGRCYEFGWGVEQDKTRAVQFYRSAAEHGLDWGMYNYATQLALGEVVAEDKVAALVWFRKAAAMGNAKAINFIGSFYEDGWVVDRDTAKAAECYARAAEGGDFRGQFNHARMLAEAGRIDEALLWLDRVPATATPAFREKARRFLASSPVAEFREYSRKGWLSDITDIDSH